jgi:hypothetical protein
MADDGYAQWYADRLWQLLPAIYRTLDVGPPPANTGPLRELINRIGAQAAAVRRSIDRLGENQSIETADDWVIPYIGDLVATRLVSCLPPAAQRIDVAKTIYYRRRAGTVGLLEELAADIASRDARVVEFFRRLGRTRHQFDPPIGLVGDVTSGAPVPLPMTEGLVGRYSRTPAGGFADLRNVYAANNTGSAFDEYAHTADLRSACTTTGWYNISHLGVFLWWLQAFPINGATPVSNGATPPCFTFDPTGRDIALFAPSQRTSESFGEHWVSPAEWQLPVPIRATLWRTEPDHLYPNAPTSTNPGAFWVGLVAGGSSAHLLRSQLSIHPEQGRFSFVGGVSPGQISSNYCFGFLSEIGAGGYSDGILSSLPQPPHTVSVSGGGTALSTALPATVAADTTFAITDSTTYAVPGQTLTVANGVLAVLRSISEERPVLRSKTAGTVWTLHGNAQTNANGATTDLVLQGLHVQGTDVVLSGSFDTVRLRMMTLDPGTSGAALKPPALYETAIDGVALQPVTLYIDGSVTNLIMERCITGPIRTRNGGSVQTLTATDSIIQSIPTHMVQGIKSGVPIFDPANLAAHWKSKSDPLSVQVDGTLPAAAQADLSNYVLGQPPSAALLTDMTNALGTLDRAAAEQAWPLALADLALGFSEGTVSLQRCTIMGPSVTHRLAASECVFDSIAQVEDPQHGCVRFSAIVNGSNLHAPYRCVTISPKAALLQTTLFSRPEYARLRPDADNTIIAPSGGTILGGAQNGAEMGAYGGELIALRKRGLAIKFEEFMPISQSPVWIDVD